MQSYKNLRYTFGFVFLMFISILDSVNGQVNSRWWTLYYPDGTIDLGVADPKIFWKKYGLPENLQGKVFYDLGCWDGGTCFEAAARGAEVIYGLDSYVWEINHGTYENFCNARNRIAPNVKDAVVEIESIPLDKWQPTSRLLKNKYTIESFAKDKGPADVVLAAGIFYHLLDPIKFLKDLKALVKPNTGRVYLTTWCCKDPLSIAKFLPGWRGDDSNFWIYSIQCVLDLLKFHGYQVEQVLEVIPHEEPLMSFICTVPE